jgi:hypothetical protein
MVVTNVFSSIGPIEISTAVHLIYAPFSGKLSAVRPNVSAFSVDVIIAELTNE